MSYFPQDYQASGSASTGSLGLVVYVANNVAPSGVTTISGSVGVTGPITIGNSVFTKLNTPLFQVPYAFNAATTGTVVFSTVASGMCTIFNSGIYTVYFSNDYTIVAASSSLINALNAFPVYSQTSWTLPYSGSIVVSASGSAGSNACIASFSQW